MLLYPVYALLFADSGLSPAAISSLFVIWSLTAVVFEVPSGVLADVVSRRLLLCCGPLLTAAGFALWTFVPSYPAFAAGFVLWGLGSTLRSGAWQALVFQELRAVGAQGRYAGVVGRSQALGTTAVLVATAVAAPVLEWGGYRALGVASVVACVLNAVVTRGLPETPPGPCATPDDDSPDDDCSDDGSEEAGGSSAWVVVREGWALVRASRAVRGAVLLSVVVTAVGALDEYVPLLAASTGVAVAVVPLLVLVVSAGDVAGGWLAGRGRAGWVRPVVAGGAVCMAVGAAGGSAAGLVLVAVAFGAFRWATAAAEARLQEVLSDRSRATVTSMAGMGSEVVQVGVFGGYALGSLWAGPGVLFAVVVAPYVLLGVRWRGVTRVVRRARRSTSGDVGGGVGAARESQGR